MRKPNTNLKTVILNKGFTQRGVAEEAGLSESVMSMVVRGKYVCDSLQRAKIAEVLRVRPEEIFPEDRC